MQGIDDAERIVAVEDIAVKGMFPDDGLFLFVLFIIISSEAQSELRAAGEPGRDLSGLDHDFAVSGRFIADHALRALAAMSGTDTLTILSGVDQYAGTGGGDGRSPVDGFERRLGGTVAGLIAAALCADVQLPIVDLLFFPENEALPARQNGGGVNMISHNQISPF